MLRLEPDPSKTEVQLSDGTAAVILLEDTTLPFPLVIKYASYDRTKWVVTTADRDGKLMDGGLSLVNVPADPKDDVIDNLAMLVRRLIRKSGDAGLSLQADDYLKRKGLHGSPLRANPTTEAK